MRARGAARFYGGERAAGLALAGKLEELGAPGARVGVADGIFTADQAARRTGGERVRIVGAGDSAEFLNPLSVSLLDDPPLVTLLRRLGIRTLGEFASLAPEDVRARFGEHGARLHALSAGRDSLPHVARRPPLDLDVVVHFEPALDRVDQVAFGVRQAAERFIDGLTAAKLVCTAIRVELDSESGEISERIWLHPRSFSPWMSSTGCAGSCRAPAVIDAGLRSGVVYVRIAPEAVDAIGNHESGLWGTGPDERVHHGLSRVQSMLGHGAVLTASVGGGRTLADRQQLVAWGDRPVEGRSAEQPWPGGAARATAGHGVLAAASGARVGCRGLSRHGRRARHGLRRPSRVHRGRRAPHAHRVGGAVAARRALVERRMPPAARTASRPSTRPAARGCSRSTLAAGGRRRGMTSSGRTGH